MPKGPAAEPLSEAALLARQSTKLAGAFRALIDSSPIQGLGPIEAARALRIDKTLASRLLSSLRAQDPMVALSLLPGTSPLRQFLRAARKHGADAHAAQAAEEQLQLFDRALRRTFGNRTRLDAALSDELPEARRRHQETARQSVYRGMALIKGISIDLSSITWVVQPTADRSHVRTTVLASFLGIRRLRPTARVRLFARHERPQRPGAKLLKDLCRPADLSITAGRQGDFTVYEVSTPSVRRDDSADVFLSEDLPIVPLAQAPRDDGLAHTYGEDISYPYKRVAMTLLLHNRVWPHADYSIRAYDTTSRGLVTLPDPSREPDRLALDADLTKTPATAEFLHSLPIPNYAEALRRAAGEITPNDFRAFHAEVTYPIYGAQFLLLHEQ